jgi:hypothetical protein
MQSNAVVVQGIVRPDGTLELAEKVSLPHGRVQVVIQPLPEMTADPFWQRMERMWNDQHARGQTPRSVDEVERQRQMLNDAIDEELDEAQKAQGPKS